MRTARIVLDGEFTPRAAYFDDLVVRIEHIVCSDRSFPSSPFGSIYNRMANPSLWKQNRNRDWPRIDYRRPSRKVMDGRYQDRPWCLDGSLIARLSGGTS